MRHFVVSKINMIHIKINMNMTAIILMNLFLFLSGFTCSDGSGQSGEHNDPLPDKRPDKMTISYGISGGMRYFSHNTFISADSCISETNDEGTISKIHFKLTPDELDKLWTVFVENKFWKIKTREEMIYDRGGESIQINWGSGKSAGVSDAGMQLVIDSWQKEWSECIAAISAIETAQVNKLQKDYEIRIDKSFFGKKVFINVQDKVIVSQEKVLESQDEYITNSVKLTPGAHRLSLGWDQKNFRNLTISPDSSKGITLSLDKDSVKTTFIK